MDKNKVEVDRSVAKIGIYDEPMAFAALGRQAVPAYGGCVATSVFMRLHVVERVVPASYLCLGLDRLTKSDLDDIVDNAKPKGCKMWAKSVWPLYHRATATVAENGDVSICRTLVRMFSLELNPDKYLTERSAAIYAKWKKLLYADMEPWQADQWAYNAVYAAQESRSAERFGTILKGLPDCMQGTLASCCSKRLAGKKDHRKLWEYIRRT